MFHAIGLTFPTSSRADIMLTKIMKDVGLHLGIELADHIIVAGENPDRMVSFRENNFYMSNEKRKRKKVSIAIAGNERGLVSYFLKTQEILYETLGARP